MSITLFKLYILFKLFAVVVIRVILFNRWYSLFQRCSCGVAFLDVVVDVVVDVELSVIPDSFVSSLVAVDAAILDSGQGTLGFCVGG